MQLFEKNFERFRNTRFGNVVALYDRFVGLYPADDVVGFDRKNFLQNMRRAVRFERPDFHFAETLSAELGFTAERLLRYHRVRSYRTSVDLIVYEVVQLNHIHITDGYSVFERFARSSVVKLNLAVYFAVGVDEVIFAEKFSYIGFARAVEYGGCDLPAELLTYERKVYFEYLTDVHTRGNAQRVKNDLERRTVCHERHIRFGKYSRNDALVTVTSRHLIADGNLSLLRDVNSYKFVYAGRKFVFVGPREPLYVYDYTAFAVRNAERGISYFSRLIAEDCP